MVEVWSPVRAEGEGNFAVSTEGRVMNMLTGDILVPFVYPLDGLWSVCLNRGFYKVHELVADAHICCLECDIWEVFHIDDDTDNNAVWNLDIRIDHDELEFWRNENCE